MGLGSPCLYYKLAQRRYWRRGFHTARHIEIDADIVIELVGRIDQEREGIRDLGAVEEEVVPPISLMT